MNFEGFVALACTESDFRDCGEVLREVVVTPWTWGVVCVVELVSFCGAYSVNKEKISEERDKGIDFEEGRDFIVFVSFRTS